MSLRDPHRSRYGRYVGGDPLAPPVDLAEALDAIGQDVMAGYSPERAMQEFLRRGGQERAGLDDLGARVAARRRELLSRSPAAPITSACSPCIIFTTGTISKHGSHRYAAGKIWASSPTSLWPLDF